MRSSPLFWPHMLLSLLILSTSPAFLGCKKADPPPPPRRAEQPKPRPPQPPRRAELPKPAPRPPEDPNATPPYYNFDKDQTVIDRANWLTGHVGRKLMKRLQMELSGGSLTKAIEACASVAMPTTQDFGKKYNATIQRVSHRNRNPLNRASTDEYKLIQQIKKDQVNDSPQPDKIIKPNDQQKIVYIPIFLPSPTCLKCHGSPKKHIESETLALIKKHYPKDRATGFRLGELRGMWKVTFQKP